MPEESPFLTEPRSAGEKGRSAVPEALFDLAVNRAALAVRGSSLEAWHARTRFARHVPLAAVRAALAARPHEGEWHWAGGVTGHWQPGKAQFP